MMVMGLSKIYWKAVHGLGYFDRHNKGAWQPDTEHRVKIDYKTIVNESDRKQCLHFGKDDAAKEEAALSPFINIGPSSRVLDLGCGDGRWGVILAPRCKEYVGVDFSKKLLEKARRNVPDASAGFICCPAQEYFTDEHFELILIIGLLTYLNDEDIIEMVSHCRKMLGKGGRLFVRNVSLGDNSCRRQVYDYRPGALLGWLGDPGYQVIRRNREEELAFFKDFRLVHDQPIAGTAYRFYIFE
jgi:ubiquinone/menaquinone biosynthesis C-methylase UbiE